MTKFVAALSIAALAVMTVLFVSGQDDWNRPVATPEADAAYYYVYLPSLVLDHDLDFSNQYEVTKNWYHLKPTPTGRPGNVFGIGPAAFELPGFLVGHGLAVASGDRRDGFSHYEELLSLWMGIPFSLAAVLFAAKFASRRVGGKISPFLGALVVAVGGPVFYYAVRQPGYGHPYATFAVALLVERWDLTFQQKPRTLQVWCVLGGCLGLAMLARPQLITWGILLIGAAGSDVLQRGKTPLHRLLARWGAAALTCLLVFTPQLIAWDCLYGSPFTVPQGPGFMRWDSPALIDVLFSARNGLFPWAPLYLPMLFGLFYLPPRRRIAACLLAAVFLQVIVNGAVWDWWAGGSFGARRFDSTYVVFAAGGAALAQRASRVIVDGIKRGLAWQRRIRPALAIIACAVACVAADAEYWLARKTSVTSARIHGGEAPSAVWIRRTGFAGYVAAGLADVEAFPADLLFSVRYSVPLGTYDRLDGAYRLGETFPGLNSYADTVSDTIPFNSSSWLGVDLPPAGTPAPSAIMTDNVARILVGLNRRGAVTVRIPIDSSGPTTVRWNGSVVSASSGNQARSYEFTTNDLVRGMNRLEIDAPIGSRIGEPMLEVAH